MIFALEGPDCSGKTSTFECLRVRDAVMVPSSSIAPQLMPVMSWVEERNEALWRALHDPRRLYICDRHVAVSSRVYSRVFDRALLVDWRWWSPLIHVVYFRTPLDVLVERLRSRGDAHVNIDRMLAVDREYRTVVHSYTGLCEVDGSVDECVTRVQEYIDSRWHRK